MLQLHVQNKQTDGQMAEVFDGQTNALLMFAVKVWKTQEDSKKYVSLVKTGQYLSSNTSKWTDTLNTTKCVKDRQTGDR